MANKRNGRRPQQYQLPTQRPIIRQLNGTNGKRIAGYDVIEYVAPELHKPLTTALKAFEEGRLGDALHWFGEAAKIDPMNKAVLYFGSEAAQRAYFQLKLADPPPPDSHLKQWRQSALDLSNALTEAYPDAVVIHNLARFIQDDGDDQSSIPIYERALQGKRDQVESWGNLGTAYLRVGRRQDAERAFSKCVAFPTENASGYMAQGYIWIRRGEYLKGFRALNERWSDRTFTDSYGRKDLNKVGKPWTGQPLKKGESVLLHGEQGLGDHVMFARYIPILLERGIPIAGLETRAALKGWFDACWLGCPVVIRDQDALPPFTHHVPIMSLPGILGLDTIPPALAPAVPSTERSGPFRVGLVWKGTRGNVMDAQRSLPDECLAFLAQIPGVEWVPLQYDPNGVDALTAQVWIGENVVAPPAFTDVLGLAELMRTCNHVLTVDTLAAHVAGSLGIPSTVLHRYHREWRWGLDSETTPWYPNQRLVTCPAPDDWGSAVREAVRTLPIRELERATTHRTTSPASEEPSSHIITVEGRYGTFHVNANDEYVGRSLIEYGEFSKGEGDLFQDLVKPDWHVIEVGANIGAHTKQLTQLGAHLTAYEPNPDNAALLRLNAPEATVIEAAVGRETGTTTVDAPNPKLPGNFGGLHVGQGTHPVRMVTLDDSDRVDFIKLDCEGMELQVLEGAPFLVGQKPIIYAEADHVSTAKPLIEFLTERGYRLWWHAPKLYSPDNYRDNPVNLFGETVSVNILAVPRDRSCPVDTLKHKLLPTATSKIQLLP